MAVYVQLHPRIMTHCSEADVHAAASEFFGKWLPNYGPLDGNTFDKIKTDVEVYIKNLLNAQMLTIYEHNLEALREYQTELNTQVLEQNAKILEKHTQYLTEIRGIHKNLQQIKENTQPRSLLPTMFRKTGVPDQA